MSIKADERFLASYVRTALWSTNDESDDAGGNPLDDNYDPGDLAEETLSSMRADCERFMAEHAECLDCGDTAEARAGHDFWLTRNGHGAGFLDGHWREATAQRFYESAKRFGEVNLYVGDDGLIYMSR